MKTEQEHSNGQCTMNNVQWKKVKLGECCTIHGRIGFRGYTTDDLVEKGYGAITFSPSDIHNFKLCYDDCDYITWKKYEESPEIKVFNGDILFCKTASIGKCAYVEGLKEKATINPQFVVLKNFQCDSKFLFYKLISYGFQTQVQGITGGSTIKTMSQEKLSLEEISVPDLPAQRRIAAILASADKVIAATQKTIAKYKQIKQGMMEDLLNEQCTMNNEQWEKVKLGEVGDFYVGGDVDRSCFSPYPTVECRFPIYANALVNEGLYGFSSKYEFDKEAITITGRGDVGKVFYRKPYFSTIIRLVTLIPTDSNIDVKFLSYAMSRINFIIESTGVPQLTAPQAKKYEVSIPYKNGKPDLPAQRRIAAILSGIDAKIAAEEKVLEKYEKVKNGLMEKLLNE